MAFVPQNPPATGNSDLERYLFDQFQALANELDVLVQFTLKLFVAIGYGGILGGANTAGGDLGAGFTIINGFLADMVTDPVDVTQDFPNNHLHIERRGVWQFNIHVTWGHNEVNNSRETNLRIWNNTAGSEVVRFVIGTGRNVGFSSITISTLIDIAEATIDNELELQLGGGDAYTGTVWETLLFSANHVSEIQDL